MIPAALGLLAFEHHLPLVLGDDQLKAVNVVFTQVILRFDHHREKILRLVKHPVHPFPQPGRGHFIVGGDAAQSALARPLAAISHIDRSPQPANEHGQ
jgi:hypothetical protein